ncbi:MAG: FUSC family protein [Mycobacteriaceae bacterium]
MTAAQPGAASGRGGPAAHRRDFSANIGLIVVVVVVMGGAIAVAAGLGVGAGIIIAGFTAIFFTLGVGGGSLRADLRKAAWYGPLTALSASVPRVLAAHSLGAALALVCVIIFVAGLLPVLGRNYAQAGLGLGIATVLGFALQADVGSPGQTVAAAFIGVGFVVVLRILMKVRDPCDVTRELAAATLTQDEPGFEQAYTMWLRDRPVHWIGETLQVAVGYRTVRGVLTAGDAAIAEGRAREVAAVVASREPGRARQGAAERAGGPSSSETPLDRALRALDRIEVTARRRDTTLVGNAAATRKALSLASVRSALTWRSQILRHALRTAVGVLLTFLVAWAIVGPRDPLVTSMATASFAILQISWTQSLFKAKQRLLGVAGGAALMALALWILPHQLLLPFSLLAALTGLWFIASNQVLSIGSFVVVSVGMNVTSRGLDPGRTLLEYVLLLLGGVTIGLLVGFAVVPHLRSDGVEERVRRARDATAVLLRGAAQLVTPATGAPPLHRVPLALVTPLIRMRAAVVNLGSPLNPEDEKAGVRAGDCASLATRFETLAIVGVLEAGKGRLTAEVLDAAAGALVADNTAGCEVDRAVSSEFVQLARGVGAASTELEAACARLRRPRP